MSALPSHLHRIPNSSELESYARDGATVLRDVLDVAWIRSMHDAIERALENPSPMAREYTPAESDGRYFGDFFLWRRDEDFRRFMADSPLPVLAAHIMKSKEIYFFYDQLLVKEPGTAEETPWHHDLPYWPLQGEQIISIWVPFDPVAPSSGAVTYVRGSHLWGRKFAPAAFGGGEGYADTFAASHFEPLPDIDTIVEPQDLLGWSLEPGDVLIHHPLTLHYARGNSSAAARRRGLALRYVGDDAVYDDRPGTFLKTPLMLSELPAIALRDGDPLRGELFPQVGPR